MVDRYLAEWLYFHYVRRFGTLPFQKWEQLSIDNVSTELIDDLNLMANVGGLEWCMDCPFCKEIKK